MLRVLDSSALLAVLFREPGAEAILEGLKGSLISSVNAAEVLRVVQRKGSSPADARDALRRLPVQIRPFDQEDADVAAEIGHAAPHLSLGDCACIALARRESADVVLTTDRIWAQSKLGVKVRVIC